MKEYIEVTNNTIVELIECSLLCFVSLYYFQARTQDFSWGADNSREALKKCCPHGFVCFI